MTDSAHAAEVLGSDEALTGILPDGDPAATQPAPSPAAWRETLLAALALAGLTTLWSAALAVLGQPHLSVDLPSFALHGLATLSVYVVTLAFYHYRRSAGIPPVLLAAGVVFLLTDLTHMLASAIALPAPLEDARRAGLMTLAAVILGLAGLVQWLLRSRTALYRQIRLNRRLDALNEMMRTLSVTPELPAITQSVLRQAMHALRAEAGTVLLVDQSTGDLEFVATAGPQSGSLAGMRLPAGTGIAGWAASQGRVARVANAQADSRFYAGVDRLTGQTTRSVLAVPILARDRTLGVIELMNRRRGDEPRRAWVEFTDDDVSFMDLLARSAAAAMENARLYGELQAADRARRELIANVAHELRAPLTFLKVHAELLAAGDLGPVTDEQRKSLDVIVHKADALAALAADVVTLERAASTPLACAPLDLARLAAEAVAATEPAAARAGLTLEFRAAPDLPPVAGDELRLTEVLDNLLSNALKFTPSGGRVTVHIEDAGPGLRVSVSDTGAGIPADQRAHIFERFYVAGGATRRTTGTGLGLAISRAIVRAHGGEMELDSAPGSGSTFHFVIPKAT